MSLVIGSNQIADPKPSFRLLDLYAVQLPGPEPFDDIIDALDAGGGDYVSWDSARIK
jgi:hypothetical protein